METIEISAGAGLNVVEEIEHDPLLIFSGSHPDTVGRGGGTGSRCGLAGLRRNRQVTLRFKLHHSGVLVSDPLLTPRIPEHIGQRERGKAPVFSAVFNLHRQVVGWSVLACGYREIGDRHLLLIRVGNSDYLDARWYFTPAG